MKEYYEDYDEAYDTVYDEGRGEAAEAELYEGRDGGQEPYDRNPTCSTTPSSSVRSRGTGRCGKRSTTCGGS